MDNTTRRLMMGAAGAVSPTYIEDVFSTWLYTGNGSTQTITNGIDLSGKGGLVWLKNRTNAYGHELYDTARGSTYQLGSDSTGAEAQRTTGLTSFTSSGFSIGARIGINNTSDAIASWTFRKQAKFFDVVTYTGDGTYGRTVSHNLGSVPGCVIVKRTDSTSSWTVYHTSIGNTNYLELNATSASQTGSFWANTTPTSTQFSTNASSSVNASGGTYVAYLFAHDAGGFGDSGSDSVIKCGSFTKTASHPNDPPVILGWEPQWIMFKRVDSSGEDWIIGDIMRGAGTNTGVGLSANNSAAESSTLPFTPLSTGFTIGNSSSIGGTYIYIAIRRGPMKTPTDATKVFNAIARTGNGSSIAVTGVGFSPDLLINSVRSGDTRPFVSRLTGVTRFVRENSAAEATFDSIASFDPDGFTIGADGNNWFKGNGVNVVHHLFRRAPGYFDVVAYTGTGSTSQSVTHSLGVKPELIITKKRSAIDSWYVYTDLIDGTLDFLYLNFSDPKGNTTGTVPTATTFNPTLTVDSGATHIAYLFASCPGVSKVGTYTGTGTTLQINCGFTSGARFVLIKRTDSTGDWYVWDSARGIVAGNDPYLLLNDTAAEVTGTDYVDTYSAGFEISSTAPAAINANGGSYIYLSVA